MHYTGYTAWIGGILILAETFVALDAARRKKKLPLSFITGYLILIASWALYVYAFVSQDYSLKPVYEESSPGLSLALRIASSWASGGGSLVLYTFILALAGLIHRLLSRPGPRLVIGYNLLILSALLLATLNGAFESINVKVTAGAGLNPLLKSTWMYPHPLSTFTGFALASLAAVALITGNERASLVLAKLGWVFLTLGLVIGGYWSYETFGWGGYWAWDPVETAELVPWLALTAYFHARIVGRRTAYVTMMLSGASVFLAIYVTRAGISPLHSFASPQSLIKYIVLATIALFLYEGLRSSTGIHEEIRGSLGKPYRTGMVVSYLSLLYMTIVVFSSLFVPVLASLVNKSVTPPQMDSAIRFYHPILYPALLALLASLPLCSIGDRLDWDAYKALIGGSAILSIVLAYEAYSGELVWSPASSTLTNIMIAAAAPLTALAIASTSIALLLNAASRLHILSGVSLLHLAIALTTLGIMLSGPFAYNQSYMTTKTLRPGEELELGGYRISIVGYRYEMHGKSLDAYTPYAGRSLVFKAASIPLLNLFLAAQQLGNLSQIANTAYEKLEDIGILGLYNSTVKGMQIAGTLNASAEYFVNFGGAPLSEGNATLRLEGLELVSTVNANTTSGIASIHVFGRGAVTISGLDNETAAIVSSSGHASLVQVFLEFKPDLSINVGNGVLVIDNATMILMDLFSNRGSSVMVLNDTAITAFPATLFIQGTYREADREAPIPLMVNDTSIAMLSMIINGLCRGNPEAWSLMEKWGIPQALVGEPLTKALNAMLPSECLAGGDIDSCLGYLPVPHLIPEGARLVLTLRLEGGGGTVTRNVVLRFEANGEIQGIHGLVTQVVTLPAGLGQIYVEVNPPIVKKRDWSLGFHELLVYYLHEAFKGLDVTERLGLAAAFASGYTSGAVDLPTLIDLYDLAMSFDPNNSVIKTAGIQIGVKEIPGVRLLWWGTVLMVASELYIVVVGELVRRRAEKG